MRASMTMGGSFVARLPLSAAMLYLVVGWGIGPAGMGLVDLDPFDDAKLLERVTEIAVLISLFTAGLKLEMPLRDRRWRIPVQLATVSMLVTVAAVTAIGFFLLGLPLGNLPGVAAAVAKRARNSVVIPANPGRRVVATNNTGGTCHAPLS